MKKAPVIATARKPRPRKAPKPAKAEVAPAPARIVRARKPGSSRALAPDLSPEEVIRRGDAAYELWCELVRRATGKEYKRDF